MDDLITLRISNAVSEAMLEHGFSQGEMAAELGVSRQCVNYWLNRKTIPKFHTVRKFYRQDGWVGLFGHRLSMILLSA
jgi:DNA-binding XRE family transcriptional regulator